MFGQIEGAKRLASGLIVLALLAVAGLGFWAGMTAIWRMVDQAAETARMERDSHWRAEIATANAAVAEARREAAERAAQAEQTLADRERALADDLARLETDNANLANGDRCGLGRDRVRLLDRAR